MPLSGTVFVSVADRDKRADHPPGAAPAAARLQIVATEGTAEVLRRNGIAREVVRKYSASRGATASRPIVDLINAGEVDIVVNTPSGRSRARRRLRDPRGGRRRRQAAVHHDRRSSAPPSQRHRGASQAGFEVTQPAGVRAAAPVRREATRWRHARDRAVRRPARRPPSTRYGPLCVGIDPHACLLDGVGPAGRRRRGCASSGCACRGRRRAGSGIVKPQVAFFERLRLRRVRRARGGARGGAGTAGLLVIADAKRGDIGSTMDAYGEACLSAGSPLEADAMTVSRRTWGSARSTRPLDARAGARRGALRARRDLQPGGRRGAARASPTDGETVAGASLAARRRRALNADAEPRSAPIGVVVGATIGDVGDVGHRTSAAVHGPSSPRARCAGRRSTD